jgi:uncharacterized membrane protein YraQ (UPF0718 family)
MKPEKKTPSCHHTGRHGPWYRSKLFLIVWILLVLLLLNLILFPIGVTVLQPFWVAFWDYLVLIWWALLIGFLLGGLIDYYIPRSYIAKHLSLPEKRVIGYSVLLGFLASACSHGILALGIELYRKGASVPAVIAFLMASPWANLPITILLFSFFGTKAFILIISAIIIALITGFIYQFLDRKNWIESQAPAEIDKGFSVRKDIRKRLDMYRFTGSNLSGDLRGVVKGSWSLTKMVMWWILIGMIMAAFARAYIPAELFHAYLGATILGLVVTLILATVIEVCSEGSAPLAFEIHEQTGAFGNSFTFLMAGVATDYTEIGLISSNIGKRAAFLLPVVTVPMILVLGYLFNLFL